MAQPFSTFRSSRIRSVIGMAVCLFFAYGLSSALGGRGLFDALSGGGLAGKLAFATLIMYCLAAFTFGAIFFRPRAIIVEPSGITVRSLSDEFEIDWASVIDVERGGAMFRRGALIETPDGSLLIGDGMGNTRRIINAIKSAKMSSSTAQKVKAPRARGRKGFGHRHA